MVKSRVRLVLFVFAVFLLVGFTKILVQPIPGVKREWVYEIPPKRGGVFDRYGNALAVDLYVYEGFLDLSYLKSSFRYMDEARRYSILESLKRFIPSLVHDGDEIPEGRFIKLGSAGTKEDLLSSVPRDLLPFLSVSLKTVRKKLDCCSIPQVLGSVIGGVGSGGVEGYFDDVLRGKEPGKLVLKVIKPLDVSPVFKDSSPPKNGDDLYLSIDLNLQKRIFEVVENAVEEWNALSGNAIIMETKTGKIRAMVTTRNWNDNVMGYIEPGSSIKPIIYSVALETGSATPGFRHFCTGRIKPVEDLDITIGDIEEHGEVDFEKALVVSCNTATVRIASLLKERIGIRGMYEWLRKFGFGKKTGVELQGEIDGVLREPEDWSMIDFAEISIGQGIGVTPVQLVSALNVVFNGGVYVKPTVLETSPPTSRRVLSKSTADHVRSILAKVVEEGTGKKARVNGVKVAGKTGTAQKAVGGRYSDHYHSIFVGTFPADDPEYTILVHIDDPKGAYLGGEVAAPVFSEIVKIILKKRIPKPLKVTPGVIPDLRGLSLKDVLYISEILNLDVKIKGTGIVVDQDPAPGSLWKDTVEVVLDQPK